MMVVRVAAALLALSGLFDGAAWADAGWAGEWGVDPSRSDDATAVIEKAYVGPAASTASARSRFSPDGGGQDANTVDVDAAKRKLLYRLMSVLGRSGRLSLGEADGSVELGWGEGDERMTLAEGRKWTRVVSEDGDRYKIRVFAEPDYLSVERKIAGAVVTETFVPDDGDLVAVVTVVGSELEAGIEFRRVYRKL
ncbi:MAG: hypothetical protein R3F59_03990 [Myxococcota bacterium]